VLRFIPAATSHLDICLRLGLFVEVSVAPASIESSRACALAGHSTLRRKPRARDDQHPEGMGFVFDLFEVR
jgi:hypothetical protein